MEEVKSSGKVELSSTEEELIRQEMMKEIPDITDDLNRIISQYDTTDSDLAQDVASQSSSVQLLTGIRLLALAGSMVLCAALIALFWRSKGGFIWCAAVTAIVSVIFLALTRIGGGGVVNLYSVSVAEQFALNLLTSGFKSVAIGGFIVAALFVAAYIILRLAGRSRRREI